jgi:hypothetical protein
VYVADWQIQCCGKEFAVGDDVMWPVLPTDRADPFWEPLLGPDLTARLWGSYEAHEEEEPTQVSGTVRGIRTIGCRMAPRPEAADPKTLHAVPGTLRLEPVDAVEKWYDLDGDSSGLHFRGWLVDLDVAVTHH